MSDLTICIPAFNEQEAIGPTLRDLRAHFPLAEIIVIDDGSTDGTAALVEAMPDIRLIRHQRNLGYGASIKTAMASAQCPIVAWYDGDGQHRPEDLATVIAPVISGDLDVVIGARTSGSEMRKDWIRGRWMMKLVAQVVARDKIPDLNSGLRAFRRDAILPYLHLLPDGFSASTTSTLVMMKRRYRIGYVPIVALPRAGTSTVRMFRDGIRTLQLIVRMLILFDAFEFFSIIGGIQIIVALAYGITLAVVSGAGFPVLAGVLFISGVITFFIGLLCDQIVALRIERLEDPFARGRTP
jgi:glycosyltransferase involved in cell wall biosynthesis